MTYLQMIREIVLRRGSSLEGGNYLPLRLYLLENALSM